MQSQHPEQKILLIISRFESDLILSNAIMPKKRKTRMIDKINEIKRIIIVKGLFSKTPAKSSFSFV
jgi:hypothetical protein